MKKYLELAYLSYRNTHAYFGDIVGANMIFVFRILFILLLYKYLYAHFGAQSQIFGAYTFEAVAWPLIFAQSISVARPRGLIREIQNDLRSGKIGIQLLLPISYLRLKKIEYFSQFLASLGYFLFIGSIVGVLVIGKIPDLSFGLPGMFVLLFFGAYLGLCGFVCIASVGFYFEDVQAFAWIYSKFDMIFWGNIMPVVFMPAWMQSVAFFSPFMHHGYSAGLLLNNPSLEYFFEIFGMQLLWIAILSVIAEILFRGVRKRITINGG